MSMCAAGVKMESREKCPRCGSGPEGPCWGDYSNLIKVEAAARELIKTGLRLTPDGLIVRESKDRTDPHYKLCEALEAIAPLNP